MNDILRSEILQLETELSAKKKLLYLHRLYKILGYVNTELPNITNININTDIEDDTWYISYIHKTSEYSPLDYLYEKIDANANNESNNESNEKSSKTTKIIFGANISSNRTKKYFIKGGVSLDLYKTSMNELRIINLEYQFDIDYDDQKELISSYSDNINIPEYAAIKFMTYMSDNEWDDTAIINHFTMI